MSRWSWNHVSVETLLGKVVKEIKNVDNDELIFFMENGEQYVMYHEQDCCESVSIEDIIGDLDDLIGSPILMAEEETETGVESEWGDTYTWTFYKFATIKGYVTLRWYGSSNGYYGESVDFVRVPQSEHFEVEA